MKKGLMHGIIYLIVQVWDLQKKKISIKNKSDGHHYKQQNDGYSFETWLEDARKCTLRPILVVEISSREPVQSNVKQGNFMPIEIVLIVKNLSMSLFCVQRKNYLS